jgi:hypothetical protein
MFISIVCFVSSIFLSFFFQNSARGKRRSFLYIPCSFYEQNTREKSLALWQKNFNCNVKRESQKWFGEKTGWEKKRRMIIRDFLHLFNAAYFFSKITLWHIEIFLKLWQNLGEKEQFLHFIFGNLMIMIKLVDEVFLRLMNSRINQEDHIFASNHAG